MPFTETTPRADVSRVSRVSRQPLPVGRPVRRALEPGVLVLYALQHQLYADRQNGNVPAGQRVHHTAGRAGDAAAEQDAAIQGALDHEPVDERHPEPYTEVSVSEFQTQAIKERV